MWIPLATGKCRSLQRSLWQSIKEQTSVIDETVKILSEIAQEHANDKPDRENEVFLVNYNEWREVGTLDFEQNSGRGYI